ncbi:MAG TPA: beta-ketoacyl-[acyl-carrier-protein] synthase II, partial [Clostridiales bacterium]|nr:beta-ketoacyl-[acyl-carrier-protein] synthase II [Clostridiales bacterium]
MIKGAAALRRVVITGMGAVTSCGMGVEPLWKQVLEGRHGFGAIRGFDTQDFAVKYAGEIPDWDPVAMGLNKKEARRMDRFSQFAMVAA